MLKQAFKALAALALVVGLAAPAQAENISVMFDPDGAGAAGPLDVNSFDWSVGNALAKNGNAAVQTFVATGQQIPFDVFYQAKLAALVLADGTTGLPPNLNPLGGGTNQITIVAGFTEVVTSVNGIPGTAGSVATFDLAANPRVNYLEFYFDPTGDANDLAGTGFNRYPGDADARLILRAEITDILASNFELADVQPTSPPNLDGFGADNYPGIDTVVGAGATTLTARVTFADSEFFLNVQNLIDANLMLTLFNSSQILPFDEVNPSGQFLSTSTTTADGITPVLDGAGAGTIGTLNGGPIGAGGGLDIQFQVDGSSAFAVIPEPASMTLLLCGAAGLGLTGIRRRRNKDAEIA